MRRYVRVGVVQSRHPKGPIQTPVTPSGRLSRYFGARRSASWSLANCGQGGQNACQRAADMPAAVDDHLTRGLPTTALPGQPPCRVVMGQRFALPTGTSILDADKLSARGGAPDFNRAQIDVGVGVGQLGVVQRDGIENLDHHGHRPPQHWFMRGQGPRGSVCCGRHPQLMAASRMDLQSKAGTADGTRGPAVPDQHRLCPPDVGQTLTCHHNGCAADIAMRCEPLGDRAARSKGAYCEAFSRSRSVPLRLVAGVMQIAQNPSPKAADRNRQRHECSRIAQHQRRFLPRFWDR